MKNYWLLASLLTASMTIATTETWGQEMSAKVPFAFHANGADLPPGHYTISRVSTGAFPVLRLLNVDAGKGVLAPGQITHYGAGDLSPRLVFQCLGTSCALNQIWSLSYGIDLPHPQPKKKEKTQLTVVPINSGTKAN